MCEQTTTRRFWLLIAAALMACAHTVMHGCTTLYHITLEEMATPQNKVVASRISEARDNHLSARDAFDRSVEQLQAMSRATDDDLTIAHTILARKINQFELEAWNLQRRIATVRDVGDSHFAEEVVEPSQRDRYLQALDLMDDAHHAMQRMLEGLRHEALLLKIGAGGEPVRMLQAAPNPLEQAEAFRKNVNAAVDNAAALLATLR